MGRPSRSDEHPPPHVQAQIEAATRDYFHHLAPKRHAKPSRSDPNVVDALFPPPPPAAAPIPELAKFQDLEAHSQKILACESDGRAVPTEEYMATNYYNDLNGMDKQHHTTGSGFIKVEGADASASGSEREWNLNVLVKNQNAWSWTDHDHNNQHASQAKGNPATNDWIPSAQAQTPHTDDTVSLESTKPHRSDN